MEISITEVDLEAAALVFGAIVALRQQTHGGLVLDEAAAFDGHVAEQLSALSLALHEQPDDLCARQASIMEARVRLLDVCRDAVSAAVDPSLRVVLRRLQALDEGLFSLYSFVLKDQREHYRSRLEGAAAAVGQAQADAAKASKEASDLRTANALLVARLASQARENASAGASSASSSAGAELTSPGYRPVRAQWSSSAGRGGSPARLAATTSSGGSVRATSLPAVASPRNLMPLNSLLATIEAVLESKKKHDARCVSSGLPRETLEQHVYTFLKSKYGLAALISQQAALLIRSTRRYVRNDGDVAAFDAVLRNEIDEEFLHVHARLKEAARETLRGLLRGPHVLDGALTDALAARTQAGAALPEAEWRPLLQRLYGRTESDALVALVMREIARRAVAAVAGLLNGYDTVDASTLETADAAAVAAQADVDAALEQRLSALSADDVLDVVRTVNPSGSVRWSTLLRLLLEFQLSGHDRFLAKFRTAFREFDEAHEGRVSGGAFRQLLQRVAPHLPAADRARACTVADPSGSDVVTFSSAVAALSSMGAAAGPSTTTAPAPARRSSPLRVPFL
jgi:hypothetical protein